MSVGATSGAVEMIFGDYYSQLLGELLHSHVEKMIMVPRDILPKRLY